MMHIPKKADATLITVAFLVFQIALPALSESADQVNAPEPPMTFQGFLMNALDKVGLAEHMNTAGIKIYGYAEGGYMYDISAPQPKAGPTFLGFNNVRSTPILDKVSLNMERAVDPAKREFDAGFRLEGIFGYDARFIHSNGLGDIQTGRYQLDPLQMYVDMALPYLPMKIRVGKWIELAGFEHFSANIYGAFGDPMRALYSYSYQFLYAEPGTQTGVLATYVLNPQWTFDAGFTDGWNQSTRDTNNYLDLLGRIAYTPSDKTSMIFVMTLGPEYPTAVGHNLPDGDNKNWWAALDLVITQKVTDKLSLGTGIDVVNAAGIPGLSGGAQQWGGVAGYASYSLDPYLTLNSRLEWYNDSADGFSTGAATGANFYESTLGIAIKPFPHDKILSQLMFRPEVRFDWSDHGVYNSGDRSQVTLSGDCLFVF
ncbi:MAG: outer membrane beta-barrel protein [Candidatus Omnitrophica bacterium]|nr:outer membrane beta-barrel protein [Candidatus Omnitrophota bacterium]